MKKRWLSTLLICVGCIRVGWSQSDSPTLNDDPVFNKVLSRRVTYPINAIRAGTYGRIYAGFDIDPRGRIQHVAILSPGNTGVGFESEIQSALKRMPPLNSRYSGRYALPVAFVFTNWGEGSEPYIPTNTLPRLYFADRLLLGEVIFRGEIRPNNTFIPPSNQIKYY